MEKKSLHKHHRKFVGESGGRRSFITSYKCVIGQQNKEKKGGSVVDDI